MDSRDDPGSSSVVEKVDRSEEVEEASKRSVVLDETNSSRVL